GSPPSTTGILSTSGNVALNTGSSFTVQLNGTTAGTGFNQLNTTGSISLGGASLIAALNFNPNASTTFTILHSTAGLSGTFSGLPDGATFTLGSNQIRINYTANDVVLTQVGLATATAVVSSANPSALGQSVTFTATVTP